MRLLCRKNYLEGPALKRDSAFTAVEIMVVVAIVSVLTTYMGVSLSIITPRGLEAQARKLVSDLCWAREMAVARHSNYVLHIDTANRSYDIYRGSIDPANLIYRNEIDADTVSIAPASATADITFNLARGSTLQPNKQIILQRGGSSSQIDIFQETGYTRWQ